MTFTDYILWLLGKLEGGDSRCPQCAKSECNCQSEWANGINDAAHYDWLRVEFAHQMVSASAVPTVAYESYCALAYGQPAWA